MIRRTQRSTLFPYTTLFRSSAAMLDVYKLLARVAGSSATVLVQGESGTGKEVVARAIHMNGPQDRKSTRLNSSHVEISYAVFCLKKKKSLTPTFHDIARPDA